MVSICDLVNTWLGCIFIICVAIGQPLVEKARFPPNYLAESHLKANTHNQNQLQPAVTSANKMLSALDTNASSTTMQISVQDNPQSINNNGLLHYSKSVSLLNDVGINPSDMSKMLDAIMNPSSQIVSFTSFDPSMNSFLAGKTIIPNAQSSGDFKTLSSNSFPVLESEPRSNELPIGKLSSPIGASSNVLSSTPSNITDTPGSLNTRTTQRIVLPETTLLSTSPESTSTLGIEKLLPLSQNPLIEASSWPMDSTGDVFAVESGVLDSSFMSSFQPRIAADSGNQHFSSFRQISQTQQQRPRPRPIPRQRTMSLSQNRPSSFFSSTTGLVP